MSKSSKNSFLMQGMILAAASIVCRVIGLLYRSPLFGIIGEEGMGYYSYAYNIYNIILLIASFSIPLAVSKSISARLAKREYAFLIAHSMLHLFGYDHMEEEERKDMEKRQEEILTKTKYTRDERGLV